MRNNLMFLLISVVSLSCLDSFTYEDDIILIVKGDSQLNITNRGENTVYYFIVEQNTAASIEWAPIVGEPYLLSGETVSVKYSEIYGLKNQIMNNDTKAVFYYWGASVNSICDVKSLVIDL